MADNSQLPVQVGREQLDKPNGSVVVKQTRSGKFTLRTIPDILAEFSTPQDTIAFSSLGGVNIGGATNGQVLKFDAPTASWVPGTDLSGVSTLAALTDTNLGTLAANEVLTYDGANWINAAPATPTSTLDALTDTNLAAPAANQALTHDGANWVNTDLSNVVCALQTDAGGVQIFGTGTYTVKGTNNVAIGENATVGGPLDIGGGTLVDTGNSVSIGHNANAGANAMAVGAGSIATSERATAYGHTALANGLCSIAVGHNARANNFAAMAFGCNTNANGFASIVIGDGIGADGSSALCIGHSCQAQGNNSIAFGESARANFDDSISIGFNIEALVVGSCNLKHRELASEATANGPAVFLANELLAITKPTITGARSDPEAALANLLTALANAGIITDSTTV